MIHTKLLGVLFKKLLPLILNEVIPLIKPLQKYVFTPNELDDEMIALKKRVRVLEAKTGGRRNFDSDTGEVS